LTEKQKKEGSFPGRPGFGLHPKYSKEVIGKKATRDLIKGGAFIKFFYN
jgi:sialic acid synthase SpsE